MSTLPMGFDWRKAKAGVAANPFQQVNPYLQRQQAFSALNSQGVQGQGELVESLLSHAQLQVLKSSNIQAWEACGKDAYKFVVESFIKPMLMPYINMHKLDGNGILYIATNIQNTDQSNTPLNESGGQGFSTQAVESGGYVYINKQILVKAISDFCL